MSGLFLPHVPLTTLGGVLRQPSFDDVPRLARLAGDRDVARMLLVVPHPYTEAHASAFIGDVLASNLTGDSLALAVARAKEPHALIAWSLFPRGRGGDHRLVVRQIRLGQGIRHRGGEGHDRPRFPRSGDPAARRRGLRRQSGLAEVQEKARLPPHRRKREDQRRPRCRWAPMST